MSVLQAIPGQISDFYPHGYCYLWRPGLVMLHLVSDSIITLSYYSIPVGLVWLVRSRRDIPFNWIFWLFALFIAGCGTTHLMEIWTLWHPSYWLAGGVKALTALASIGTAIALVPLLPKAAALPTPTVLERTNRELEAANLELESFSYSVSHDLRAPLRAIDGFSRILQEDYGSKLDPEAQRLIDVVRRNSQRMGQLIDDLLGFSRLGRTELQVAPVDMAGLVEEVITEARQDDTSQRLRIEVGEVLPAMGDRGLLRQVLANLVDNAVKFTAGRSDPWLQITSQQVGEEVVYRLRDNGAGFDMQYADKLFGVFQRLHPEDQYEGTGVGLALSRRILQRHGGRIWAEGRIEAGATFSFALPRVRDGRG